MKLIGVRQYFKAKESNIMKPYCKDEKLKKIIVR